MAYLAGLDPLRVWELTPAELYIIAHTRVKQAEEEYTRLRYSAWYTAYFSRAKKMPDLKAALEVKKLGRKTKDRAELKKEWKELLADMGGK